MELNKYDWHKRPAGCDKQAPCPVCGCPAAGTLKAGRYHRAVLESEGFPFPFIVRKVTPKGPQQVGLYPVATQRPVSRVVPMPRRKHRKNPDLPKRVPVLDANNPGDTTLNLLARAAMLYVMGEPFPRIDRKLKLKRRTVNTWKGQWPEHWEAACRRAQTQIVKMVNEQMGTTAILDDVDGHLQRAEAVERFSTFVSGVDGKPTVTTFFESHVLPVCLDEVQPRTLEYYRIALKYWRLITGDPPLESVTVQTLTLFRDALKKRRGRYPGSKMTNDSIHGKLRSIQTILDKAGPPGRRNRDAKGLLATVPWVRPPRIELKLPRVIPPEMFKAVYHAAARMNWPVLRGLDAAAWWEALLVVAYNTQLRRRTLFEMRMDEIDWTTGCLKLPGRRMKAGRPFIVHLNPPAMEALRGIRTARELVFPLPGNPWCFDRWFHLLQDSASIPRTQHFGLHAIRKTSATILAGFSPEAAQLSLGHGSLQTTLNHYINPTSIVGAALDAMPQPFGATSP